MEGTMLLPKVPQALTEPRLRRRVRLILLGAALLFGAAASGCDPQGEDMLAPPEQPGQPMEMMKPPPPPPDDPSAIKLSLGSVSLRAGEERTVCVTRRLSLPEAVNIVKVATRQTFSHHVIVYRYTSGTPSINDTAKSCQPLNLLGSGNFKVPLFIGESADDAQNQLDLPPGVAYHVNADDYYTIEAHLLNASPRDATATAEVILTPAKPGAQVVYADMLFVANVSAFSKSYDGQRAGLPPMKKTTIDAAFATVNDKLKVFGLTTHQHRRGVGVTVAKSTGNNDPGTNLFTNTDWSHPELFRLPDDKPLTFQKGEGLRFVCTYDNPTGDYVRFGDSAETDEMCIIWGYYYPSIGFQLSWK